MLVFLYSTYVCLKPRDHLKMYVSDYECDWCYCNLFDILQAVDSPWHIDILEDYIYWIDRSRTVIEKCDKFHCQNVTHYALPISGYLVADVRNIAIISQAKQPNGKYKLNNPISGLYEGASKPLMIRLTCIPFSFCSSWAPGPF